MWRIMTYPRQRFDFPPSIRILSALLLLLLPAFATPDLTRRAEALYHQTEYKASLQILSADPTPDSATYALMGKDYYMLAEYHMATELFERAHSLRPQESEYELWLGRAYGRRAETGSRLLAATNASKARQHFENAAALDPHNADALSDLFEYYLKAPEALGGGLEKAEKIAQKIAAEKPAEAHLEFSEIAERRKQYAEAETQLRQAIELEPGHVGRVLDLAHYLAKRGRAAESDALFAEASRLRPEDPRVLFERAETYIEQQRNPEEARHLLQQYLSSSLTPDNPSKSAAEKLLHRVTSK
jgi:tetratricopeptide (TPR) repeat protein